MIEWTKLLFTTLWTLGSAVLLATLSLAHWSASQSGGTLRQTLTEPPFRLAMTIAFILVALGLTLSVEPWWHKIVWFGVLILSIWEGLAGMIGLADQSRAESVTTNAETQGRKNQLIKSSIPKACNPSIEDKE